MAHAARQKTKTSVSIHCAIRFSVDLLLEAGHLFIVLFLLLCKAVLSFLLALVEPTDAALLVIIQSMEHTKCWCKHCLAYQTFGHIHHRVHLFCGRLVCCVIHWCATQFLQIICKLAPRTFKKQFIIALCSF